MSDYVSASCFLSFCRLLTFERVPCQHTNVKLGYGGVKTRLQGIIIRGESFTTASQGVSRQEECRQHSGATVSTEGPSVQRQDSNERLHRQLYFAFGSNLSYTQMRSRSKYNPEISSVPLAIGRLDGWRWIICGRGYANIVRCDRGHHGAEGGGEEGDDENVVYGVIYGMTEMDECLLDGHEGVDVDAADTSPDSAIEPKIRPKEQDRGSYNKWYLPVTVTAWLDKTARDSFSEKEKLSVLAYVDEYRRGPSVPKEEYVDRMNRGIREAISLGLPQSWIDKIVRKFIPQQGEQHLAN